jgi:hypothetical protein
MCRGNTIWSVGTSSLPHLAGRATKKHMLSPVIAILEKRFARLARFTKPSVFSGLAGGQVNCRLAEGPLGAVAISVDLSHALEIEALWDEVFASGR